MDRERTIFITTMLAPAFLVLAIVIAYPIGYAVWISMHDWNPMRRDVQPFIGFENYARMLFDPVVWKATSNTLKYVIIAVTFEILIGLGLALVLHQKFRGVEFIRTIFMLPLFIVPVAVGVTWRLLLNQEYGPLFYILHALGLVTGQDFGLSNPSLAIIIIACVSVWQITPFVFLIFVAGLQSVPAEQYEAIRLDGANSFQEFIYVTLPWLKPLILFALLFRVMESFKVFDLVLVLTGGGPGNETEVLNLYIYRQGFVYSSLGYASAIAVSMLLLVFTISFALVKAFGIEKK